MILRRVSVESTTLTAHLDPVFFFFLVSSGRGLSIVLVLGPIPCSVCLSGSVSILCCAVVLSIEVLLKRSVEYFKCLFGLMHLILSELYNNHQIVNTSVTDGG